MKNNKPGFTLIELMAVIVILGILATIVAVNVSPFLQRANLEKMRADISQIEKALELYKFNELAYPSTDQGLQALMNIVERSPEDLPSVEIKTSSNEVLSIAEFLDRIKKLRVRTNG